MADSCYIHIGISVENAISTIYANDNSAALADLQTLHAFFIAQIQAALCFYNHMIYSPLNGEGL